MTMSLSQVLVEAGYDVTTKEDAIWLKSKEAEFERLIEQVEEVIDEE